MQYPPKLVVKTFLCSVFAVLISLALLLSYGSPESGPAMSVADSLYISHVPDQEEIPWPDGAYSLRNHDLHPLQVYPPFFLGENNPDSSLSRNYLDFFDILEIYDKRQGVDDNFTLRVLNNSTKELLEVHVLEAERLKYIEAGFADWEAIDRVRRTTTRELVEKHVKGGIDRQEITVRWGRLNQVLESRERKAPFMEYELSLARSMGLSILPTEIPTVETFNQDHLVSSAGARSRYQMMPHYLRRFGLNTFTLPTSTGRTVHVRDERHPLLSLEPAFIVVRAYANAVGHEIPGISAYHTGPSNIYHVFKSFLRDSHSNDRAGNSETTVLDAYIWALTDGFAQVSETSTFRNQSRGYIPAALATLRAIEHLPVDPSRTLRLERFQLKDDIRFPLSKLLSILDDHASEIEWGRELAALSSYERFNVLNPHIALPHPQEMDLIPEHGDVILARTGSGNPVRLFLPIGSSNVLERAGHPIIDRSTVFRYDENTYRHPVRGGEKTSWDLAYEQLVSSVGPFGFTTAHRERLREIKEQFDFLAAMTPSHYRMMQAQIVRLHLQVWDTRQWRELAETVEQLKGEVPLPPKPLLAPAPSRLEPFPPAVTGTREPAHTRR